MTLWEHDDSLLEETSDSLSSNGKVEPVVIDVADLKSVRNAAEKTEEYHGTIEVLVFNAGIAGPTAKIWEYPPG